METHVPLLCELVWLHSHQRNGDNTSVSISSV